MRRSEDSPTELRSAVVDPSQLQYTNLPDDVFSRADYKGMNTIPTYITYPSTPARLTHLL